MSQFYPVYLELRGRCCVVLGGGAEAEKKAIQLLEAGAHVTVVSPQVTKPLEELAASGSLEWIRRSYRRGDLVGAFLAIAAPGDRSINREVWEEAEEGKVLLNAVDDVQHCHFIAPAIYRQGDISVAISTAGKAPALAVRLRDRIVNLIGADHAALVDLLAELRGEVTRRIPDFGPRKALWYAMVDSDAIEIVRRGDITRARVRLLEILRQAAPELGPEARSAETIPSGVPDDRDTG